MVLLLQLNAELPDHFPDHARRLYLFACRRAACQQKEGCVRAVRGVCAFAAQDAGIPKEGEEKPREPEKQPAKRVLTLGEQIFGESSLVAATGWANSAPTLASDSRRPLASTSTKPSSSSSKPSKPSPGSSPAAPSAAPAATQPPTFAAALSPPGTAAGPPPPRRPHEPWPAEAAQPPPYPVWWITEALYEVYDATPARAERAELAALQARWAPKLDRDEGRTEGDDDTRGQDRGFLRFLDRVAHNPEQVIRYQFGGRPLLYSHADAVGRALQVPPAPAAGGAAGMARCGNCGAQRVFEVQLMPRAIAELEEGDEGMDGMEWGTIIVGTCERNCVPPGTREREAGYLEEWVGVQWER